LVGEGYEYWDKNNHRHPVSRVPRKDKEVQKFMLGDSMMVEVDESLILAKMKSLSYGRYPGPDDKLDGEWPKFELKNLNHFEKRGAE